MTNEEINKLLKKKPFTRQANPKTLRYSQEAIDTMIYSEMAAPRINREIVTQEQFAAEFDPLGHEIYNKVSFPDKLKYGEAKEGETPNVIGYEPIARIGIPWQEKIALNQCIHLTGNELRLSASKDSDAELFVKYKEYRKMKGIHSAMQLTVKSCLTTGDGAIYFFRDTKGKLRWNIWSYSNGDAINPTYKADNVTLDKFCRRYWSTINGKTADTLDVITERTCATYYIGEDKKWTLYGDEIPHGFSVVPVAYQRNEDVAWGKVQPLCDIMERTISDLRESDAYFALGILFAKGSIEVLPNKQQQGKVILGEENSDAKFLEQSDVSKGFVFELEFYRELILDGSGTVLIRHKDLKGGDISGVAIANYYFPAIQYAKDRAPNYYFFLDQIEAITKDAMGLEYGISSKMANLDVVSEIEVYIPANTLEVATKISTLRSAGALSVKTVSTINEYAAPDEYDRILNETPTEPIVGDNTKTNTNE